MPKLRGDVEDDRPRDPAERAGRDRRCHDLSPLDDEDIVRRAFRDVASVVQHQRFIRLGEIRFDPGEDVVEIIQRLDRGIQSRRPHPPGRHVTTVRPRW